MKAKDIKRTFKIYKSTSKDNDKGKTTKKKKKTTEYQRIIERKKNEQHETRRNLDF